MKKKKKSKTYQSEIAGLPYPNDITTFSKIYRQQGYKVPANVLHLLHVLRAGMHSNNVHSWRSMEVLAVEMSVSKTTVLRAVNFAKKHRLITVGKRKASRGFFEKNQYRINYPFEPVGLTLIEEKDSSQNETCIQNEYRTCIQNEYRTCIQNEYRSEPHLYSKMISNISSGDLNTLINQSIKTKRLNEGEKSKKMKETSSKKLNSDLRESENLKDRISADSLSFKNVFRAPPAATEKQLQEFYGGQIPKVIDLTVPSRNGKVDLSPLVKPFRKGDYLNACFGQTFNEPLDEVFERQIDDFYENTIALFWEHGNPGPGFEVSFKRCCRSGAMSRCGLHFKTPEQIEKEQMRQRAGAEAKAQEARKMAEERKINEAARRMERKKAEAKFESMCEADQRDILEQYEFTPLRHQPPFDDFLLNRISMLN